MVSQPRVVIAQHRNGRLTKRSRHRGCAYGIGSCIGCSNAQCPGQCPTSRRRTSNDDREVFFNAVLGIDKPKVLQSPALYREKLFEIFVSDLDWLHASPSRYLVNDILRVWFTGTHEVMSTSTDVVLLLQFARITGEIAYQHEALRRYGTALGLLTKTLRQPGCSTEDLAALAASNALAVVEMYAEISHGQKVWTQHTTASSLLLRYQDPQAMDIKQEHRNYIMFSLVYHAVAEAISARQPFIFGTTPWLKRLESCCHGRGWCFFHLTCRIPVLLHEWDTLRSSEFMMVKRLANLVSQLFKVANSAQRWLLAWYGSIAEPPLRTESISRYPTFLARYGVVTSAFPQVYSFASQIEAQGHLLFWTFLFALRRTIYDIYTHPAASSLPSRQDVDHVRAATTECADSLCRLAPYLQDEESGSLLKSIPSRLILGMDDEAVTSLRRSMMWPAVWYEELGEKDKAAYAWTVLGEKVLEQAGVSEEGRSARNGRLEVNGFVVRKLLLQHCIGPPECVLSKKH